MIKMNYFRSFFIIASVFLCFTSAAAQEGKTPETPSADQHHPMDQQKDMRANMLRRLGLSEEQIKQMRMLNAEKRPLMAEAQKRLRDATRSLDEAIYADQVNDNEVQLGLKELQLAQADVAKLRYMNELAVRRILTQEQLVRFREMRQRFEKARQGFEQRRRFNVDRQQPGKDRDLPRNGQPQQQRFIPRDKQKPII